VNKEEKDYGSVLKIKYDWYIYILFWLWMLSVIWLIYNSRFGLISAVNEFNTIATVRALAVEKSGVLDTFINLSPFLIIYGTLYNKNKLVLTLFLFSVYMALFLSMRVYLLYNLFVFVLAYYRRKKITFKVSNMVYALIFLVSIIFISEWFRYGIQYSKYYGSQWVSIDTFYGISGYLFRSYVGKDIYNSLVMLNEESIYSICAYSQSYIKGFAGLLGLNCADKYIDYGKHGTINFISILYREFGVLSVIVIALYGIVLQEMYKYYYFSQNTNKIIIGSLFLGASPFLYRTNFFAMNIVVLPVIAVLVINIVSKVQNDRNN